MTWIFLVLGWLVLSTLTAVVFGRVIATREDREKPVRTSRRLRRVPQYAG